MTCAVAQANSWVLTLEMAALDGFLASDPHCCFVRKVQSMCMYRLKPPVIQAMIFLAAGLIAFRGYLAVAALASGYPSEVLAFPLTVILPGLAFAFLVLRRDMLSREGALMQLGAMIQILLILALPRFGLHLALGFPIVFLIVELFETRMPVRIKVRILHRLVT